MGEDRRPNRNRARNNRNRPGARDNHRTGSHRRVQPGSQRSARYSAQGTSRSRYQGAEQSRSRSRNTSHDASRDPRRASQQDASRDARRSSRQEAPRGNQERGQQRRSERPDRARSGAERTGSRASERQLDASKRPQSQERTRSSREQSASAYDTAKYTARKRGMSTGKKVALGIVIALVAILAAGGAAFAVWYIGILDKIHPSQDYLELEAPVADEPYYVLLVGSDSREGFEEVTEFNDGERADSIMVARVDEQEKKVSILSVPRDLRVKIPGHGYTKINSAVEYGGYDLLISILNDLLDIKINHYATVYFDGFLNLVDTVGGVTVEVPEGTATYNEDESYPNVILPAGDAVKLNGEQALILARCRHGWPIDQGAYAMGDYQRTLNQRNLIKAIAKEVLAQDITKLPALIGDLADCIETDMSVDKIVSLAMNMRGMEVDSIETTQLPIGSSTIDGGWQAVIYQDVFELMDQNFRSGQPLFAGLDNFNPEFNDDDVGSDYVDGPVYAYTTYTAFHGSPYSGDFTPSSFTREAISKTSGSSKTSSDYDD